MKETINPDFSMDVNFFIFALCQLSVRNTKEFFSIIYYLTFLFSENPSLVSGMDFRSSHEGLPSELF